MCKRSGANLHLLTSISSSVRTLLTLLVVLFVPDVYALRFDAGLKRLEVQGADIRYLKEDEGTALNLENLIALPEEAWQVNDGSVNFGFSDTTYWFKFDIQNGGELERETILQLAYPMLDYVTLAVVGRHELRKRYSTGDLLPFKQRPLEHRHFLFPLTFAPNETLTLYLKVQTSGSLKVPLVLWERQEFYGKDAKITVYDSMYFGILLVMAAFNLMLYFSIRDVAYLFYVFFVSSIFVLMTSYYGYSFQYFLPDYPRFQSLLVLLIVPITHISILLFAIHFLRLADKSKTWYLVFLGIIGLDLLCLLFAMIFPYGISTRFSVILTLPIALAALTVGIRFWQGGDIGVRLFSVAWLIFLLGVAATVLNQLGLVPYSVLLEHSIPISTSAQTVLFALALASRFNDERNARMNAQQQHLEEMRKRRQAEKQALHAACHHEITGLPNRVLFEKTIAPLVKRPLEGRENLLIVLLHVKRFDDVNKTLGHRNADILLEHIGERINFVMRGAEDAIPIYTNHADPFYAAHVEGVSFCFALANSSRSTTLFELECLIRLMTQPLEFMGLSLELGFMVGCTFVEDPGEDPHGLLRQAFIAFDQAEENATSIAVYEPSMNPYSPRRLTLMTELRAALDSDGLELYFQPQVHLQTGRVSGFEALLRWIHKEHGFIPPDEFIPMAEKTGLMKPLTKWVLRNAMVFCKKLEELSCPAHVSVNVSALNLQEPGFCRQVTDCLKEFSVPAERLVLEVTETAAMTDPKSALEVLLKLQKENVRLSIDDFGTGHSSLSYIRKLPVQEIKIDRSFVGEMDKNKGDATIVKTTINMCHDLGYEVVAEGVENEEVMTMLRQMNCDIVQGYFIAKPMNTQNVLAWLKASSWKVSDRE